MREAQITDPTARYVIEIIVVGIVATLVTDIWQRLLQAIAGVPPARWGLIGRWVAGFPRGVFVHQSIAAAQSVRGELALGWAFHYAIGIVWAALYIAVMRFGLNSGPMLISAVAVSLALLVAPWFVMQPALGMGFMASRTPKPAAARAMSVLAHAVFGIGLYLGAIGWTWLAGAAS
jgi:hypothetical protein